MRNFTPDEFSCNCGCGGGYSDMDAEFLDMLDNARDYAGVSACVMSLWAQ